MKLKLVAAPSPNFSDRKDKVQFIIIHATGAETLEKTFSYLIDSVKPNRVSSHFVIDTDGTVYGLVDTEKCAFHAGISDWQGYCERTGYSGLNDASIGIELQCPPLEKAPNGEVIKFGNFSNDQIMACTELCRRLMRIYQIPPKNVLRHSDISPNRKFDPGETFPWSIFQKMLQQDRVS